MALGQGPTMYYRLTNSFGPPTLALNVANVTSGELQMAPVGDIAGQYWYLVPVTESPTKFRLQTVFLGSDRSLDVVMDDVGKEHIVLAPTSRSDGQIWSLYKVTPAEAQFKLTNELTGPTKFLEVTEQVHSS